MFPFAISEDVPGLTAVFGFAALALWFAWRSGYRERAWEVLFVLGLLGGLLIAGGIARLTVIL